jgi:hypothetical protein
VDRGLALEHATGQVHTFAEAARGTTGRLVDLVELAGDALTLQQEQARTNERLGAETRRQQEALLQQWQQGVRQGTRVQR